MSPAATGTQVGGGGGRNWEINVIVQYHCWDKDGQSEGKMAAIVMIVLSDPVSFTYWPRSSEVIRGHQRCPDHLLQLFFWGTRAFATQQRHMMSVVCPGSAFRSSGWTPKTLYIDVVWSLFECPQRLSWLLLSVCRCRSFTQLFSNELALRPSSTTEENLSTVRKSGSETIDGGLRWTPLWAACQREYCHWTCAE